MWCLYINSCWVSFVSFFLHWYRKSKQKWTWGTWGDWLEANHFIDDDRWNLKNQHPHPDLPQTCRSSKLVCTVCIHPTDNLLMHPRESFIINERWYNKWNTHKSTINKRRLEQKNLKYILNQAKQSIDVNKSEHPTSTLATTFHKPSWEVNMYVQFGYGPQKLFWHTWGQVSESMNSDTISANKQVNKKRCKDDN